MSRELAKTLQILIWSRFDGEYGRRRRQKAVSPLLSMFLLGGVPLFANAKKKAHRLALLLLLLSPYDNVAA